MYSVYWRDKTTGETGRGTDILSYEIAEDWVKQLKADFPDYYYWIMSNGGQDTEDDDFINEVTITVKCPDKNIAKDFLVWLSEIGEQDFMSFMEDGDTICTLNYDFDNLLCTITKHE